MTHILQVDASATCKQICGNSWKLDTDKHTYDEIYMCMYLSKCYLRFTTHLLRIAEIGDSVEIFIYKKIEERR